MTETKECGNHVGNCCSTSMKRPGEQEQDYLDRQQLGQRMHQIKHKIMVLSGKGGVGKSTVAVNLAVLLSMQGHRVGLLDVDIHGPSVPRLLNLESHRLQSNGNTLLPVAFSKNLKVMSIGFMLEDRKEAIIWRGPMKSGIIKQFLKDVEWGELDYLIIDSPPGTGDEPLSVCQLIENAEGALIVTTPPEMSLLDVRKSITFCQKLGIRVLGVIENMSGFSCPKCGEVIQVFPSAGAREMAREMAVPFLGQIPIDPSIASACDDGTPYVARHSEALTTKALEEVIDKIEGLRNKQQTRKNKTRKHKKEDSTMKIAIPTAQGKLTMHFGHCEAFSIVDVELETKTILESTMETPPSHEPGVLPRWLSQKGVNVIIAGGMGSRAQALFAEQKIEVVTGASSDDTETLVNAYLNGSLKTGQNACDH